ncbi:acyl-homoserine-lactone acylase [Kitasatospora sp. MAP12-15]|uniref:penicillin acylase family protein n=1 Tax=unclassified Kitasatospora TaxID=2633591 RepID=UPI002475841B|nr:penicillin acylase family protein [Kitasatospora sp. MAP12-44]MDH6114755.1 acyl-homoserine-lactone acylase [Kitasatospora sp. MAP12-44]
MRSTGTARIAAAAILALTPFLPAVPAHAGARYQAEIRRTAYGIPHIEAADYASLGYGEGYAFAQDDFCLMAQRLVTLDGRRSRYFGAGNQTGDPFSPGTTNLASDVYFTADRTSGDVPKLVAGLSSTVRSLVGGYVDGYNRYLADTGTAQLPDPTCRGTAWVRPMTQLDVYRHFLNIIQLGGETQYTGLIATAAPPTTAPPTTDTPAAGPPRAPRLPAYGSNAMASGSTTTRARGATLLSNSHFPWTGYLRYHQIQLTIPGQLDVTGAALAGTPLVEDGDHNENVAWSHPVSTAQTYTLYRLTLAPGDPTAYLVDGKKIAMTRRSVTVNAGDGTGKVTRILYSTRYGPLLADGWTTSTAYAIRDANSGNLRGLETWLDYDRSRSVADLKTALAGTQGLGFVDTVAADSTGHTLYAESSVVPHVTDDQLTHCAIPTGSATVLLDGSTTRCDWGSDPDAVVPGIFGPGRAPTLTTTGNVADSNTTPWLADPSEPLTGYPAMYGAAGTELSMRGRLGLSMIAQRVAGTDGYGPAGFDLPSLEQLMLGDRDYSAELLRDQLVRFCRASSTLTASDGTAVDVRAACDTLARWDLRGDPDSRGAVLWREFMRGAGQPFAVPFDPARPLTTPRDLDTSDPAVGRALADAVQRMQHLHLPLDVPLGAVQQAPGGIPVPGCTTEVEGCYNAAEALGEDDLQPTGAYPAVSQGSSFIMAVQFTPTGPQAATIMTYSESADPSSPHHTDQTRLYARKIWIPERYTEAQIAADPALRITYLTGGGS